MKKYIVLDDDDVISHIEIDYNNPSLNNFRVDTVDCREAHYILYIHRNRKTPYKVKGVVIKSRYDQDRTDELTSMFLEDEF